MLTSQFKPGLQNINKNALQHIVRQIYNVNIVLNQ